MVKKCIELAGILLIFLLIANVLGINREVFAKTLTTIDVTEDPSYWSNITQADTGTTFTGMIKTIVSTIRYIGMIVSVATISIIGIKFMVGSVEEKAQYKQTLMPWLIGAILLFAITLLPDLLYKGANKLFP